MTRARLAFVLCLAIFFLCMAIGMVSCKAPHYCGYDHKPEVNKVYDPYAGRFDYERWHGEEYLKLNCEL